MLKSLWASVEDPSKFRVLNGWLTVTWFAAAIPICLFLSTSVPFLVFISVYAVVTGHLATWQAARVEERQEKLAKEKDDEFEERLERKMDDLRRLWEDRIERDRLQEDPPDGGPNK
jgi:hypothetical protein